jgi:hypothetical protein
MMAPELAAAVGRIVSQAARLAELRDRYQDDAMGAAAVTYGHAAAYAMDTDLCDIASALAPEWGGNDIRTDAAGYAARLRDALGIGG